MTSTSPQTIPPQDAEDVVLQVYVPAALKERLRGINYDRRTTYRELVIRALEETFPSDAREKVKRNAR